jgi:energy-coupling factor transporter ATP-binding protein EcfA2
MRLRYLSIDRYPPLSNATVCFSVDAPWPTFGVESIPCGIHFVAGLNGSGKSHLLRAISSIFLAMADGELPGFPFTLIYELGRPGQTSEIIFDNHLARKSEAVIWQRQGPVFNNKESGEAFEALISALRKDLQQGFIPRVPKGSFPQSVKDLLPKLLAYTSGSWRPWEAIWQPPLVADERGDFNDEGLYEPGMERPVGWTHRDENVFRAAAPAIPVAYVNTDASDLLSRPFLLSGNRPDAALLAVVLHHNLHAGTVAGNDKLAQLLEMAGWHKLVSVRLRIDLDKVKSAPQPFQEKMHDLLLLASEVIPVPHPEGALRLVYFDADRAITPQRYIDKAFSTAPLLRQTDALALVLGKKSQSAFSRFHELIRWLALGLVDDLEICIRRDDPSVPVDKWQDRGILAYSEMSDGEQMVLRRWALFYLLSGESDALLLLDEPETHFNDSWKREIVSIIEGAMGGDHSTVLVASHSSIVLSDVFDEEVILVSKNANGRSSIAPVETRTFGSEPGSLVMKVFNADDSIGARAKRRIDGYLKAAEDKQQATPQEIADLEALIHRLGTGFYRSELRTVLNRWKLNSDVIALNELLPTLTDPMKTSVLELIKQHLEKR